MDWIKAILGIIAIVRAWLQRSHDAGERKAGADEANLATEQKAKERVREAMEAEVEVDHTRAKWPGDVDADDGFRRD